METWPDVLRRAFHAPDQEGEDKVVPLGEAVARHLRPGDIILLDRRANATMREVLRQFRGKNAGFTVVSASIANDAISLIHAGLVPHLVCGMCMHRYPSSGPIRIVQDLTQAGRMSMENWSLVTLNLRLKAAALGLPFLPTRSLMGSTAAEENSDGLRLLPDPFGERESVLALKPLRPDVALVHAIACDRYGNAILPAPVEETLWGPRAARRIILTTERLVPTWFIRRYNGLVSLPGSIVTAVSLVPFGAHPEGMPPCPAAGLDGYKEDYTFMVQYRQAAEGQGTLDPWLEEWVYACPDNDAYLRRLGAPRLDALVGQVRPESWRTALAGVDWRSLEEKPWSDNEMMIIAAARLIARRVREGGFRGMLCGIGPIFLAGGLAYYWLRQEGYGVDCLVGSGEVGYEPLPGDPNLLSAALVPSCKLIPEGMDVYAFTVGGADNNCLSVVGGMQIDARGNINSTRIGGRFMNGVGGVNDAANAREVFAMVRHGRRHLVEKVPYVTAPGHALRTLVTSRAVFEKAGPEETFVLTALLPQRDGATVTQALDEVASGCCWPLRQATTLQHVAPPTRDELLLLRALDTQGVFL